MTWILGSVVAFFFLIASDSTAQAREGFIVGLDFSYDTIAGDFDGDSAVIANDGSEVLAIPDSDSGFGVGLRLGFEVNDQVTFEGGLSRSRHDSEFIGADFDVSRYVFDVSFKYNFLTEQTVQPYLIGGLGVYVLIVEDGAAKIVGMTTKRDDATYYGNGLHFGGGMEAHLGDQTSGRLQILYRLVRYDTIEGVDLDGSLDTSIKGDGVSLAFLLIYHFSPRLPA